MAKQQTSRDSETVLMDSVHRLANAGGSVIQVKTREPLRTALTFRKHFITNDVPYTEWDVINGKRMFTRENYTDHKLAGDSTDFLEAFMHPLVLLRNPTSEVYVRSQQTHFFVYVDPHPFMSGNPVITELVQQYAAMLPATNVCTILITPDIALPDIPVGVVLTTEMPTPTIEELEEVIERITSETAKDAKSFPDGSELDENDFNMVAKMGLGLTLHEAETYAAIAIIEAGAAGETAITLDRIMGGIAKGKTSVVKQSEILELHHPEDISNVGGMGNLKEWVSARANCYSEDAVSFGIEPPKGMVLVGVPGCLTGDTMIDICRKQRPGGYTRIRLDALFYRFNDRHEDGAFLGLYDKSKEWDLSIPTQAHCYKESEGYIGFNEIEGVVYSGLKEVFRLTTDHGVRITATADHKFLTPTGYVRLGDLAIGGELFAHQEGVLMDDNRTGRNRNKALRQINNVGNHPNARVRVVQGLEYSSYPLHRLVVEAHMNGMALEDFLYALHGDTTHLHFLDEGVEVHHRDRDRDNNTFDNLQVLSTEEHARLHMGEDGNINRYKYAPRLQKVTSIEPVGKRKTFDIQMKAPDHNFVANGLVVHNSGKSLFAKVTASMMGIPLVRLDFGRVFSKYVGDSESRVRSALAMVESMAPVVLFVDEIDKGLGGAGGGGDSGTSARVLGSYLTWLQECKAPVFNVVTANRVDGLPPELLRRGRFDQIFFAGLPSEAERIEVLKIHLRKRGRSDKFSATDLALFSRASERFVPAEIESCVKDAMVDAFNDSGVRDLTMQHILHALSTIIPMSKSNAAHIERIVEWGEKNAINVSKPALVEAPAKLGSRILRARGA